MRRVKRWRYYCDHCKKSSGAPQSMVRHERGCTMNPQRQCGVCKNGIDLQAAIRLVPPIEHKTVKERVWPDSDEVEERDVIANVQARQDPALLKAIREACDNCPACILAVLRQAETGFSDDFDVKAELAKWWDEHSDRDDYRY